MTKVECHTLPADDFATNWKCYCKTEGCNHKCEYKNKPEMCADKVIDVGEGETETDTDPEPTSALNVISTLNTFLLVAENDQFCPKEQADWI